MRSEAIKRIADTSLQVFVERLLRSGFCIVWHRFIKNAPVTCLLDICADADDQPQGIVVEVTADIVVPPLRQRLVLVIRASGAQLRGGEVEDAFTGRAGIM